MASQILRGGLLTSALLLLTACTVDVGRSASSASATDGRSPPWAITLQRQSSIAGSELHEINESDLRSGDLLFSSSPGVTSLGIRAFSASSVSHVALYLGDGQIAEATGAGVQIISVQQALAHSDKLFALRVPDLTPDQVMAMKTLPGRSKTAGITIAALCSLFLIWSPSRSARSTPSHETFASSASAARQSATGRCGKR